MRLILTLGDTRVCSSLRPDVRKRMRERSRYEPYFIEVGGMHDLRVRPAATVAKSRSGDAPVIFPS